MLFCDGCGEPLKLGKTYHQIDGEVYCKECWKYYLEQFSDEHEFEYVDDTDVDQRWLYARVSQS